MPWLDRFSSKSRGPGGAADTAPAVRHVHLLDTSVGSDNTGDEIIVESARAAILPRLQDALITTSSSHDGLGPWSRPSAQTAQAAILLGTNALSAARQIRRSRFVWTVTPEDMPALSGKVVLLGCGANSYFDKVEPEQAQLLNTLLSADHVHSVRDELGAEIVRAAGHRAINTSCPTLWRFAAAQQALPSGKADAVCFTLTKHKADPADSVLIDILKAEYDEVHFWPQQLRDLAYLESLTEGREGVRIIAPNLMAYDRFLSERQPDVVGTRLHGTIRGLHHGCRAVAIAIDNRAAQIGAETGLPTVDRPAVATDLAPLLNSDFARYPAVEGARIDSFLTQFDLQS